MVRLGSFARSQRHINEICRSTAWATRRSQNRSESGTGPSGFKMMHNPTTACTHLTWQRVHIRLVIADVHEILGA